MPISTVSRLLGAVSLCVCATAAGAQVPNATFAEEGYDLFELHNGAYFDARIEARDLDTLYLTTPYGAVLKFRTSDIKHGIVDQPSGGEWRPREDQREQLSHRFMVDVNMAQAEYGYESLRAGLQLKYSPMFRVDEHWLVGPMIGVAAMRVNAGETVMPVGLSAAYEINPRLGFVVDGGYSFGLITRPNVEEARGGLHLHPRFTVRTSHPNHFVNMDFGIGYLFQRAEFLRFESPRFPGESALNPSLPGTFWYRIPYQRLSLSFTVTFG